MQLPSIDRTTNPRPAGADLASAGANRVIPVAPVNPAVSDTSASTPATTGASGTAPTPGVVNHVSPALQNQVNRSANEGEPVYTSVPDPLRANAVTPAAPHDWTLHKPAPEKTTTPPAKPMSQVLMDQLKTVWTASASAVQIEQVKNQLAPPTALTPATTPGILAKQSLTYVPSQVKSPDKL